jgi:hypothetical protein
MHLKRTGQFEDRSHAHIPAGGFYAADIGRMHAGKSLQLELGEAARLPQSENFPPQSHQIGIPLHTPLVAFWRSWSYILPVKVIILAWM